MRTKCHSEKIAGIYSQSFNAICLKSFQVRVKFHNFHTSAREWKTESSPQFFSSNYGLFKSWFHRIFVKKKLKEDFRCTMWKKRENYQLKNITWKQLQLSCFHGTIAKKVYTLVVTKISAIFTHKIPSSVFTKNHSYIF